MEESSGEAAFEYWNRLRIRPGGVRLARGKVMGIGGWEGGGERGGGQYITLEAGTRGGDNAYRGAWVTIWEGDGGETDREVEGDGEGGGGGAVYEVIGYNSAKRRLFLADSISGTSVASPSLGSAYLIRSCVPCFLRPYASEILSAGKALNALSLEV